MNAPISSPTAPAPASPDTASADASAPEPGPRSGAGPKTDPSPSPADLGPEAPLTLSYATPSPRGRYVPTPEATRLFWGGVRKCVLAGGVGLVCWGLASIAAAVDRHAAAFAIGWGITLVVLMCPFPFGRRPGRKKEKRRRQPGK